MAGPALREPPACGQVSIVIPARNEAATITAVTTAALGSRLAGEVIVVDDGSCDDTGKLAKAAGAIVVRRDQPGWSGSKALAMEAGVELSSNPFICFIDGDLIGITGGQIDALIAPVISGDAELSCGMLDYRGFGGWWALRCPPITGNRAMARKVFEQVPPEKRRGYMIDIMINEVIAEGHLRTTSRLMRGVHQRSKRDKLGRWHGWLASCMMMRDLLACFALVRPLRTYWSFLRRLTIQPPV